MENQKEPVVNLDMDIADFSGKVVKRIDLKSVISRSGSRRAGIAVVMTFTDGATGTILVRSGDIPVIAAAYARPKMDSYSVEDYEAVSQAR